MERIALKKYEEGPKSTVAIVPKPEHDSREISRVMDDHSVKGLALLWTIAVQEEHPWHKRYGFEALRELVRATTPKRKEISGHDGGPIEFNLKSLFYDNSLPADIVNVTPESKKVNLAHKSAASTEDSSQA